MNQKPSLRTRVLIAAAALALPLLVYAAVVEIAAIGPDGYAHGLKTTDAGELLVNQGSNQSSVFAEVVVLSLPDGGIADGGTATKVPASPLAGRKSLEIQNNGPNAIWCRADGVVPVATKARQVAANGGTWSLDCSDGACPVQCIAATADQASGAATGVTEIR